MFPILTSKAVKGIDMIKWVKLDAGEYESEDKRFYVLKTYDRIFGNHWILYDNSIKDYYKRQFHEYSLKACKAKAEVL